MTSNPGGPPLSIEDVLSMPDGEQYELFLGELKLRQMSTESTWVGTTLATELVLYARQRGGWAFANGPALVLWRDRPEYFVRPDGAYFAPGQLAPADLSTTSTIPVPPVLVVEVISTHDNAEAVVNKIFDYLDAGVRMVWVVYPTTRQVHVYRPARPTEIVQYGEELTGYDVLPEFRCETTPLFRPRAQPQTTSPAPD